LILRILAAALGLAVCLAASPARAGEGDGRVWRIMPAGDSITEGGRTFSNYRVPLLRKLTDAGYKVEYTGSKQAASPLGPLRHEGYGGKNAEFIATVIGKSFKEHPADVVLVHAGHNHFLEEKPVPGIVTATESMIRSVRAVNPKVIVLVAQVIPSGKLPKYAYIPDLNDALAKMAAWLHDPKQPVVVVDQAKGFDWHTDTIADHVHPNAQGAEKMAARWFETLAKVMGGPKGR
jgi:lysophospholipase L1-like esterase